MGSVISSLRDVYFSILGLLALISESSKAAASVFERISKPKLPHANPTSTFWQENPLHPELVNIQSAELPQSADIVIIGSGMSGASIAYTILNECLAIGKPRNIVILEGRTICSGATGRNGGHIKASPYYEYARYKKRFGAASARKIVAFHMQHRPFLLRLAQEEGLEEGEARDVTTVDAFTEAERLARAVDMLEVLREDVPELAKGVNVLDAKAVQEEFGFSGQFHGAISYASGAMWPYRFVTALYATLLAKFPNEFSIETGTMVQAVQATNDSVRPFLLKTSRGEIKAVHVVHATDAFGSNLVPGLVGKLFSLRGHMSAQRPGKSFPNYGGELSWSIVGPKDYEYITQRPGKPDAANGLGAEIMIGGGSIHVDGTGLNEVGQWDDDKVEQPIGSYLAGALPVSFRSNFWGEDADGSSVKSMWTGIMGLTCDLMPLVGRISPSLTKRVAKTGGRQDTENESPAPAEWISAGFNGSGMVLTWLSGVAVALQILGRENVKSEGQIWKPDGIVSDWFPEQFACEDKRIARASIYELPSLI
ncbi:FAD dependent oxidoreductase-like protein [Rhexocercosporidium sp. MPI-PUGE-AT-0058]|nr:FAD dependent oxidoreductase-like protein [Rhexocercosporidium sp. MPI-PUGE-AT-0058]